MKLVISSDKFYSDTVIKELIDFLETVASLNDAIVYYQYPIYVDIDDKVISPEIMVVSPIHGVVIINSGLHNTLDDLIQIDEETSLVENYVFSKLIKSPLKELKENKRTLAFELRSILYFPTISNSESEDIMGENIIYTNKQQILDEVFITEKKTQLSPEMISEICSILEGSKMILKPKKRDIAESDTSSKGYILKKMEEQIAYLDVEQKSAALSQINGPQRIRGLAGSGKTIILCMKAALIHLREPNKKILYTFMTRSLYDYIETMIIRFYRFFGDGNLPDFEKINIAHSWGGENISGVYYSTCKNNNIIPITFKEAKNNSAEPFDYVCNDLLEKTQGNLKEEYDYVLMDEAQDFRPSFYQICRAISKNDCLVWCYDDLQNIFNVNIQDTIATFKNKYGAEGIDLSKLNEQYRDLNNDVVLAKTYRNPREILVLAHAIGFGIYNDTLIQTLENNQHWIDFGYNVLKGQCKIGDEMIIERPKENSPLLISTLQAPSELIELKSHSSKLEELQWVANEIIKSISEESIRPDDIIVISLDDKNSKNDLARLSFLLKQADIETFNITDSFYSKGFIAENCVTLSTVYKAKGNEAAIVYVIGTDVFEKNKNRRMMRNKVFTAFTRAKGWLKISGVDMEEGQLWKEIDCVIKDDFVLKFIQTEPKHKIERDKKNKKNKEHAKKKIDEILGLGLTKEELMQLVDEELGDDK